MNAGPSPLGQLAKGVSLRSSATGSRQVQAFAFDSIKKNCISEPILQLHQQLRTGSSLLWCIITSPFLRNCNVESLEQLCLMATVCLYPEKAEVADLKQQ